MRLSDHNLAAGAALRMLARGCACAFAFALWLAGPGLVASPAVASHGQALARADAAPPARMPERAEEEEVETSAGPVNPVELRAFVAGVLAQQRETRPFAGCVVTIVKDGRVFLNQGFGYADVEARTPVDPERTLFRIGSISKVFVYLALRQQMAAGRLTLDAPIGPLLGAADGPAVAGPATAGGAAQGAMAEPPLYPAPRLDQGAGASAGPLTLRHLVTHTAGFDEAPIGLFSYDPAKVRPLGELLAADMPPRVRAPGIEASYSNHGTALAARLVEIVSGEAFPDYLQARLLTPLGLVHTTIAQPVPASIDGDSAIGYRSVLGTLQRQPFEIVPLAPVGGMSSTGTDMATLMRELLQPVGAALPPAEIMAMRERLHAVDPRLPAMLFGLYERDLTPRSFGHGGDTIDFHAEMRLFPEQGLGVFIAFNSEGGEQGVAEFMRAFVAHYFPRPTTRPAPVPAASAPQLAGWYVPLRVSQATLARVVVLLSAMRVQVGEDGLLMVPGGQGVLRFGHVDGDYFRELGGRDALLFQRGSDGAVTRLLVASAPMLTFVPVPFLDLPPVNALWLGSAWLVLLAWTIGLPVQAWRRWRARRADRAGGTQPANEGPALPHARRIRHAALALWASAALLLVGIVAFAALVGSPDAVVFGELSSVRVLLWLLLAGSGLAVLACALVWRAPTRPWTWWCVLAALGAAVLWLGHWNLLGFHYLTLA